MREPIPSPGGWRARPAGWAPALSAVLFMALFAVLSGAAGARECPFAPWTAYRGTQILRTPDARAYLYVTSRTAIDADGAPRAYHPDDVGRPCGRTGAGLDCPANAGYPATDWWNTVLAPDPQDPGRAFVQPGGPGQGFFVSMTALSDTSKGARDPARYVDAATVPYLVFPRPFHALRGTGRLGDIGIARHLGNGRQTSFVVADIGPDEPLGEASIALFAALGGENPNPRTGSGVAAGATLYLLFPSSVQARARRWPLSAAERDAEADHLLATIGGPAVLAACAERFR